jgi:2-dehydro-3-deoxyphosphooctonate aldolase (KDO 8-P synthase)
MTDDFIVIAGTCQWETGYTKEAFKYIYNDAYASGLHNNLVLKASFDKANRTNINGARGLGAEFVIDSLSEQGKEYGVKTLTDVHESFQPELINNRIDVLQVPAMLSRQTDLLLATRENANYINVKMGQWMGPDDVAGILSKVGDDETVWITYRGTAFGYNRLVVDFTQFQMIKDKHPNIKMIFDATHSVQIPGGNGTSSGCNRDLVEGLVSAAVAQGYVDGVFLETHPEPAKAQSDGPNSVTSTQFRDIMYNINILKGLL